MGFSPFLLSGGLLGLGVSEGEWLQRDAHQWIGLCWERALALGLFDHTAIMSSVHPSGRGVSQGKG